jgi:hypothetical protein
MSSFNPEISAKALMPRDLLSQASALHFSLHLANDFVEVALAEAAGGGFHWSGIFKMEHEHGSQDDSVLFVNDRNWGDRVFRKCSVTFDSKECCLVPRAFFSPERASQLLAFQNNSATAQTDFVEIPELDAVIVFQLPHWADSITKKFPNARIYPLSALALRNAVSLAAEAEHVMGIYTTTSSLILTVFKSRKIQMMNVFPIENDEDVLYHTSNAAMRLNIDFENAALMVATYSRSENLLNLIRHYNRSARHLFVNESSEHISFISHLHSVCA